MALFERLCNHLGFGFIARGSADLVASRKQLVSNMRANVLVLDVSMSNYEDVCLHDIVSVELVMRNPFPDHGKLQIRPDSSPQVACHCSLSSQQARTSLHRYKTVDLG